MANIEPKDMNLLDHGTHKVKDVFPNSEKPYLKCPIRKDTCSGERHLLYIIPSLVKGTIYVDLGALKGGSSAILGHGIQDVGIKGTIYTVDLFELDSNLSSKKAKEIRERLRNYFKDSLPEVTLNIIKHDSSTYADILNTPVDFVFIDADHRYEGCKKDFVAWEKYIKIGGMIAFHDCHLLGVNRVITEMGNNWELVKQVYSIKLFRKIG